MGFIEQRLFDKLESIHQSCGEVCNTRLSGPPGKVINQRGGVSAVYGLCEQTVIKGTALESQFVNEWVA